MLGSFDAESLGVSVNLMLGVLLGLTDGKADSEGLADGEDWGIVEKDGCNEGAAIETAENR